MKRTLKRIEPWSLGKILALLYGVGGLATFALIAALLLIGCLLALTACGLLILYPAYPDKNPIYFVLLLGLFMVGYAGHKRRVNALLRDLRRLLNKGATR